jgi:hypothetical protein
VPWDDAFLVVSACRAVPKLWRRSGQEAIIAGLVGLRDLRGRASAFERSP